MRLAGKRDLPDQEGPAGNVDGTAGQGLVHGEMAVGIARDALAIAERLGNRLAEDDAAILCGVVKIDVQIALGLELDVDQSEWRASCSSMWSRNPMPVAMLYAPVPSRSTFAEIRVSLVWRSIFAVRVTLVRSDLLPRLWM